MSRCGGPRVSFRTHAADWRYAFAAYNLYLDYINILLYMLQAMGERR